MKDQLRVSNPPSKPLMIWDGECHFCRRWIERWREITAGEVEYAPYQEIAVRFPEIPREQFRTPLFISIRTVRFSSRRKRFINRYVAAARKNGCGGATSTFPVSLRSLNLGIASS